MRFPAKNSTRRVPLFERPIRDADESEEDFGSRVRLYERLKDLAIEARMLGREHTIRLQHARSSLAFEFASMPKDRPIALEWVERWRNVNRGIVADIVVAVHGAQVGDVDLGKAGIDPNEMAELVDQTGMLVETAARALEAQNPTREESDFFGSS